MKHGCGASSRSDRSMHNVRVMRRLSQNLNLLLCLLLADPSKERKAAQEAEKAVAAAKKEEDKKKKQDKSLRLCI